jgi:hypothetical protein
MQSVKQNEGFVHLTYMMRTTQIVMLAIGISALSFGCFRASQVDAKAKASPWLAPDQVVVGSYTTDKNAKIEWVAVAAIEGDSIRCKKPDGSDYPEMVKEIQTSIKMAQFRHDFTFRPVEGKKNRILVFKVRYPHLLSSQRVQLLDIGGGEPIVRYPLFYNSHYSGPELDPPYSMYIAYSVAVDPGTTKTTALLAVSTYGQNSVLKLKQGESVSIGGMTAKIKSISPYKVDKENLDIQKRLARQEVWRVEVETPQCDIRDALQIDIKYKSGQYLPFVDKNGVRVPRSEVVRISKLEQKMTREERAKRSTIFGETFIETRLDEPITATYDHKLKNYLFNSKPEQIPELRVDTWTAKLIEFKDIPLFD